MTCLTELIERGYVTPHKHESNHAWWAFFGTNSGKVIVKKWFPLEDLVEIKELVPAECGVYVLEKPFCAPEEEAYQIGTKLLFEELARKGYRVRFDSARYHPFYLEKIIKPKPYHRFNDIELD